MWFGIVVIDVFGSLESHIVNNKIYAECYASSSSPTFKHLFSFDIFSLLHLSADVFSNGIQEINSWER